ncbi:MAG: hypothetical protein RL149_24, partial [Actinomycetota bacterium]
MAKSENKAVREPGRIRQLLKIYALTAKTDKSAVALSAVGFVVPIGVGLALASFIAPGSAIA